MTFEYYLSIDLCDVGPKLVFYRECPLTVIYLSQVSIKLFMKFVQLTIDAALGAKFGTNNLVVYLVLFNDPPNGIIWCVLKNYLVASFRTKCNLMPTNRINWC